MLEPSSAAEVDLNGFRLGVVILTGVGNDGDDFKVGGKEPFYCALTDFPTWAEVIKLAQENCVKVHDNLDLKIAGVPSFRYDDSAT